MLAKSGTASREIGNGDYRSIRETRDWIGNRGIGLHAGRVFEELRSGGFSGGGGGASRPSSGGGNGLASLRWTSDLDGDSSSSPRGGWSLEDVPESGIAAWHSAPGVFSGDEGAGHYWCESTDATRLLEDYPDHGARRDLEDLKVIRAFSNSSARARHGIARKSNGDRVKGRDLGARWRRPVCVLLRHGDDTTLPNPTRAAPAGHASETKRSREEILKDLNGRNRSDFGGKRFQGLTGQGIPKLLRRVVQNSSRKPPPCPYPVFPGHRLFGLVKEIRHETACSRPDREPPRTRSAGADFRSAMRSRPLRMSAR